MPRDYFDPDGPYHRPNHDDDWLERRLLTPRARRIAWGLFVLGALLWAVTGCTQAIVMRHADGRTANCGHVLLLDGSTGYKSAPARERQCIEDFKEQGFRRQP